jgi:hypothetical protein
MRAPVFAELRAWLEVNGYRVEPNPTRSQDNDCEWYAHRRSSIPVRDCECNGGTFTQIADAIQDQL